MSCKLCCGTLSVSQLTIPAIPTNEIEDDSSTSETISMSDHQDFQEEVSGISTVCEDTLSDLSNERDHDATAPQKEPDDHSLSDGKAGNTDCASGTSKQVVRKKVKAVTVNCKKGDKSKDLSKKKSKFWPNTSKLKKKLLPQGVREERTEAIPENSHARNCVCIGFRKTEDSLFETVAASSVVESVPSSGRTSPQASVNHISMGAGPSPSGLSAELRQIVPAPQRTTAPVQSLETRVQRQIMELDEDQFRIAQGVRDIELGVEVMRERRSAAYPHFQYPSATNSLSNSSSGNIGSLVSLTGSGQHSQCSTSVPRYPAGREGQSTALTTFGHSRSGEEDLSDGSSLLSLPPPPGPCIPRTEYTQIDYIHCLVPDLARIANCSFYWGVMDRYEAERLLENRPEGTFLLRDSAQDDFLFSVSFRRYQRSLHARIDQWNHKFSFDTHDPGVFAAATVTDLIEHYKDPNCCMFFEPMLTIPLARKFPFSLQHVCRTVICSNTTYDGLSFLPLPKSLLQYLKYYHYKQKVRVRRMQVFN